MKRKIIYIISFITFFTLSLLAPVIEIEDEQPVVPTKKVSFNTAALSKVITKKIATEVIALYTEAAIKLNTSSVQAATNTLVIAQAEVVKKPEPKKVASKPKVLKTVTTKDSTLKQVSFEQLPGWNEAGVRKSLLAFQKSCKTFLKQKPNQSVGSKLIQLKAKDWHPACKDALSIDAAQEDTAREFFEKWFYPIELAKKRPTPGLFTGYYMPLLKGNLKRTKKYNTPIYGLPRDLGWNPGHGNYYTRAQIDQGVLKKKAPVIAWIDSPIERLFMEIEGSGVIKLASGKSLYLGYAGENGAPYTSIGSVLIKNGVMNKHNASKSAIKRYLESEPAKAKTILHKNKSFVFFEHLKKPMALGAQGMALTPGYSLAIDKKWIPLGAPLWLTTKIPDQRQDNDKKFQRLMIAQDTGGAINGLMRGDIYWGSGKRAAYLGEHMKNEGHYWLLLPKRAFDKLATHLKHWPRIR